jgi:hypothetical protein
MKGVRIFLMYLQLTIIKITRKTVNMSGDNLVAFDNVHMKTESG